MTISLECISLLIQPVIQESYLPQQQYLQAPKYSVRLSFQAAVVALGEPRP